MMKHLQLIKSLTLSQWTSPVTQLVQNPPAMQETQETWVSPLGQEDSLEEEMETHSIILAWRIPWTEVQSDGFKYLC